MDKKIGIALGGGGAKGIVHVSMLEVIDEFGIKPHRLTGTSIGAIVGVLYASGSNGIAMREYLESISYIEGEPIQDLLSKDLFKWFDYFGIRWHSDSVFDIAPFLDELMKFVGVDTFEELDIPMKTVAADLWSRQQIVGESGDIRSAVHASMALPGLFPPVVDGDNVLIDGGVVNPVPYDLLDDCDIRIAIDVMGSKHDRVRTKPKVLEAVFNSVHIMQHTIFDEKCKNDAPDYIIQPDIRDIQALDFLKAGKVLEQGEASKDLMRRALEDILETPASEPKTL